MGCQSDVQRVPSGASSVTLRASEIIIDPGAIPETRIGTLMTTSCGPRATETMAPPPASLSVTSATPGACSAGYLRPMSAWSGAAHANEATTPRVTARTTQADAGFRAAYCSTMTVMH